MGNARPMLSYREPHSAPEPPVSPLNMVLLALPGLYCWSVVVRVRMTGFVGDGEIGFAFFAWYIAYACAAYSFFYVRYWRIWYVALCLAINTAGLLFTIWTWVSALLI